MVVILLWTRQKNSWVWHLHRCLMKPFLFMLICQNHFLFILIFLGCNFECILLESNFEVQPCSELFFGFLFICYGCSCIFKRFLVTDQLELEKTKIHSQFLIFLILHLHRWCNKNLYTKTLQYHTQKWLIIMKKEIMA